MNEQRYLLVAQIPNWGGGGGDEPQIPNDEIWYTSSDGNVVEPYSLNVFGANKVDNTYSNGKGIIKFDGDVTSIGDSAFQDCTGLTSITIPNSVTSIGSGAFSGCTGITSFTIPNSITSIGAGAFTGFSGITSITIPDSVTSIEFAAFLGCDGLTSITIPNSVKSIGDWAFDGCKGLTSVKVKATTPPTAGNTIFNNCTALTEILVPSASVDAYKSATNWSTYADKIKGF